MPTTYASDAERAANRQELYNMMANAQASPYYITSGGWYGNPMYNAPVYNNLPLAAHQASGAHYSAPGSREGWEEAGAPPVIYQRSPYATAAFRVTQNPWGGASVAPLVGFPSRYPHVLSGVPMQPGSLATAIMAPYIMRPQPAPTRPAAPAKKAAAKTTTQTDTKKDQPTTQEDNKKIYVRPASNNTPIDYMGTSQLEGGGALPDQIVTQANTVEAARQDPRLTQQNPGNYMAPPVAGQPGYLARLGNRAASAVDAMEDLYSYGRYVRPVDPFAGDANRGIGEAATDAARRYGLNRGVYMQDLRERMAEASGYNETLRQQRGY